VKAFSIPVLPWTRGLDVKRLDLLSLEPVLHAGGDKLGPVAAQVLGHSIAGGCGSQMRVFFPAVASGAGNVDFYFVMNAP
jgi:hypothetical protein